MPLRDAPQSAAEIGDLGRKPYSDSDRERRRRFALLWEATKAGLEARGWNHHPGSIAQLYIDTGPSKRLDWALASPAKGVMSVRLNFVSPRLHPDALTAAKGVEVAGVGRVAVSEESAKRAAGLEYFVEARVELAKLFAGCQSAEEMSERLASLVLGLVDATS